MTIGSRVLIASLEDAVQKTRRLRDRAQDHFEKLADKDNNYARGMQQLAVAHEAALAVYEKYLKDARAALPIDRDRYAEEVL